ncbi:MAG: gamma-glutamyltransferase [Alphaproteobacteria bacterium]
MKWTRHWAAVLAVGLATTLAGCGKVRIGAVEYVEGFFGGVMADEPRAVLVGRDVLLAGGTAADAAVASYFTMAVTLPNAASLGGGGVCLVSDPETERTEALIFLPTGGGAGPANGLSVAVPGNVRGMFALHARYGLLNWANLLQPAEARARDGNAISRAFARELSRAPPSFAGDPEALRVFNGGRLEEGQIVQQVELAAVLSRLRSRPGDFYGGLTARQFVESVGSIGGRLTIDDLRNYRPSLAEPLQVEVGINILSFSPPPVWGGVAAAQMWLMLSDDDRFEDASREQRSHLLAEAGLRVQADRARRHGQGAAEGADPLAEAHIEALLRGLDPDRHVAIQVPSATPAPRVTDVVQGAGLVVVDRTGQAVSCAYTMGRPFGVGKLAPGMGILLAATPPVPGTEGTPVAVALLSNPNTQRVFFGAAAAGDASAASALATVVLETLRGDSELEEALARPRVYHPASPDIVYVESGLDANSRDALQKRGHELATVKALSRVSAFRCRDGLPPGVECRFGADPRGFGLSASADE